MFPNFGKTFEWKKIPKIWTKIPPLWRELKGPKGWEKGWSWNPWNRAKHLSPHFFFRELKKIAIKRITQKKQGAILNVDVIVFCLFSFWVSEICGDFSAEACSDSFAALPFPEHHQHWQVATCSIGWLIFIRLKCYKKRKNHCFMVFLGPWHVFVVVKKWWFIIGHWWWRCFVLSGIYIRRHTATSILSSQVTVWCWRHLNYFSGFCWWVAMIYILHIFWFHISCIISSGVLPHAPVSQWPVMSQTWGPLSICVWHPWGSLAH